MLLSYTFKLYATRQHERPVAGFLSGFGILGFLVPSGDGTTWKQHQPRFQRLASFQDRQDSFHAAPQIFSKATKRRQTQPFPRHSSPVHRDKQHSAFVLPARFDTRAPDQDKLLVSLATSPLNLFVSLVRWLGFTDSEP